MAYKNLGTFLTKVTLKAISKLDESSSDECMRIATNVYTWASSEVITEKQVDELISALPVQEEFSEVAEVKAVSETDGTNEVDEVSDVDETSNPMRVEEAFE